MLVPDKLIPGDRDHEPYAVSFGRSLVFRHHHTGPSACCDVFLTRSWGYAGELVVLMDIPEGGSVVREHADVCL